MTATSGPGQLSHAERLARAAAGMPAAHPELITRPPGRTVWKHFARWLTELWPHDEYTAIIAAAWRRSGS